MTIQRSSRTIGAKLKKFDEDTGTRGTRMYKKVRQTTTGVGIRDLCTKNPAALEELLFHIDVSVEWSDEQSFYDESVDQEKIIGLLLRALDEPFDFIIQADDSASLFQRYFANYLKYPRKDDLDDFIEGLTEQAIAYYGDYLDELFQEIAAKHNREPWENAVDDQIERNLYARRYPND